MAEIRSCRRPACRRAAVASLSYRYATREVWIGELTAEPDPSWWDLCPGHADALIVPRGWDHVDERVAAPPTESQPPAAAPTPSPSPSSAVPHTPAGVRAPASGPVDSPVGGRYALLHQDLPRVAAEVAASVPRPSSADAASAFRRSPLPSRELAPLVTDGQADGQLPLGVNGVELGAADDSSRPSGVVVPIRPSGGRRRNARDRVKT